MMMRRSFGKRGCLIGARIPQRACISFGKRFPDAWARSEDELIETPVANDFALLARKCLLAICCDLSSLYQDSASPHGGPICRMTTETGAKLLVGDRAIISVDTVRGLYVLTVRHPWGSLTVETASVPIMLDHLINHLVEDCRHYFSRPVESIKAKLLECTLLGIERSANQTKQRQPYFNKTRTVEAPHVSVCSISDSVENAHEQIPSKRPDGQILHLRGSPPDM